MKYYLHHNFPTLGVVTIVEEDDALVQLSFGGDAVGLPDLLPFDACEQVTPLLERAVRELNEYFAGARRDFDLPLAPQGTPFQRCVWDALRTIPYGETRSYGEIAAQVGKPGAARAVGGANNRNPLALFIPCHRVIGADGSLTGFASGLDHKHFLLELERHATAL
jgi:methylated-DNA-[protein]-cysteine S-methyltransferase